MIQKAFWRLPHQEVELGAVLRAVHSACSFRLLRGTRSPSFRRFSYCSQNSFVLFFTAFCSSQCSYASVPSSTSISSHVTAAPSHSFTSIDDNTTLGDELKEKRLVRRNNPFQSGSTSSSSSLIYHVPVLASRLVGRQKELLFLWQQILRGKHTFIVTGVDGIGKSAFCAEFCDRARRSNRFSCVHWLSIGNGESAALKEKLKKLFSSMAGRQELDVLLVLNNIPSHEMEATLAVLPTHSQVYFLLNTTGEVFRDGVLGEQVNSPVPAKKGIPKDDEVEQHSGTLRKRWEASLISPCSESSSSMSFPTSESLKVIINEDNDKEGQPLGIEKLSYHPGQRERPVMLSLGPLLPEEANCFHSHLSPFKETTDDKALGEVFQYCAFVPLLLNVALPLLEEKCFNSAGEMLDYLKAADDNTFPHNKTVSTSLGEETAETVCVREVSVSKQLSVLLKKSLDTMERQWPNARKQLTLLALLHAEELSESFVSLLFATEEMSLTSSTSCSKVPHTSKMTNSTHHFESTPGVALAVKFGLLSPKWSASGGYRMHSTIADVLLRQYCEAGEEKFLSLLSSAADHVAMMWPKRWRGLTSEEGFSLVRHSCALLLHAKSLLNFSQSQPPALLAPPRVISISPSLIYVFDKCAQFLAYYARENLPLAGDMWYAVFCYYVRVFSPSGSSPVSSTLPPSHFSHLIDVREAVRIGIDCGRVLHYLKDDKAYQVLETIRQWCLNAHGELSLEYGLVLSYLAPYFSASSENIELMDKGIAALEYALSSEACSVSEEALSVEELKMVGEALFVVLLRKGQTLQETGREVPNVLWERLLEVEQEIKNLSRTQSEKTN